MIYSVSCETQTIATKLNFVREVMFLLRDCIFMCMFEPACKNAWCIRKRLHKNCNMSKPMYLKYFPRG